jgi:alpha-ribazole phosphatase
MALKLWLVRHARVLAPEGICYGASDLAAAPDDTLTAAQNAAKQIPHGLPLYTSPLQRCSALARQLRKLRPDLAAIQSDDRLMEMNFGQWEAYPWADIPRHAFDAWMADFGQHRFGGEESTQVVINRLGAFAQDLQTQGVCEAVCVCHAGSIRALHYLAEHGRRPITHARQWPSLKIDLACCVTLEIPSIPVGKNPSL